MAQTQPRLQSQGACDFLPPAEGYRPRPVEAPHSLFTKLRWYARLGVDLQLASICNHLDTVLVGAHGTVVDVGCGSMPYRQFIKRSDIHYIGFDVDTNGLFGPKLPDVQPFDGDTIPLDDNSADTVLCIEVLEHHPHPMRLVDEMCRILKPGGTLVVTVPWSARMHFMPLDFHRFTRSTLDTMFDALPDRQVIPRGTDVAAICNKLIVMFARCAGGLTAFEPKAWLGIGPLAASLLPAVILGQLGIRNIIGSKDDPLGFTVIATKAVPTGPSPVKLNTFDPAT